MNTVEERLARYRYELDAVETTDRVAEVTALSPSSGHGRRTLLLVAAAVLMLVGLVAVTRRDRDDTPSSRGGAPFVWTTSRVQFTANTFTVDVGGQEFSPTGVVVDAYSDPGDATYATLELEWEQHGVPMRVYLYFAADASDWWVTELRTYDGRPADQADWVALVGEQFRTPLGGSYVGDVDVTATDGSGASHVRIGGLTLAMLPPSNSPDTGGSVPSVTVVADVSTTIPSPAKESSEG